MAKSIPAPIDFFLAQADLTVTAPGPLTPELAADLALVADLESGGAASAYAGAGASSNGGTTIGGSTAIGNQLNVVVQGSRNTVIVNSTQTNTGAINAGTALNGNINLP